MRHPTTKTWVFPEPATGDRINLRELAARFDRFEHHLIVVARIGSVQLELATASEPLYFAHVNISDEYAVALPTGDPLLDAFPLRTFITDRDGTDVARYNHKAGDLVLHPVDYAHWPGKLRPPYEGMAIPPGMRRAGLSLVYCANVPTPSIARPAPLDGKRASDVKSYTAAPLTLSLADLLYGPTGTVASVGGTKLDLFTNPLPHPTNTASSMVSLGLSFPNGAWIVVLVGERPCELTRVAPRVTFDPNGIERALIFYSADQPPDPVPESWRTLPAPAFAPFEDAAPGELPFHHGELRVEAAGDLAIVRISDSVAETPRYWFARMLFRIGLHDLRLGYIETYGGVYVDDTTDLRIGIRGGASITIPRAEALGVIERLYRSVAPPNYRERLE